ncbi:MAG: excinuclease ABC subunit C [Saprospiraceae bacterium]
MSEQPNLHLVSPSNFDVEEALAGLSTRPGVYIYRDEHGEVLYVGKAKHLKKRVSSYFRTTGLATRTMLLVSKIASIETHQTHTEVEALLLENNLIKQYKPHYNILLKDDKSYPYLRLHTDTPSPWLSHYRGSRKRSGHFFGPFPNAGSLKDTLGYIEQIFKLRQCSESIYKNRSRPCLQYQIKRCSAPCVDRISKEDYAEDVRQAVAFLEGKDSRLASELGDQMQIASDELEFEKAAALRDRIGALKRLQAKQYITGSVGDADVIALKQASGLACFYVEHVRHGRNLGGRYHFQKNRLSFSDGELMSAFLPQYYFEKTLPKEILISTDIDDIEIIVNGLKENNIANTTKLKTHCRGHRKRWQQQAMMNVEHHLNQHLSRNSTLKNQYTDLAKILKIESPPSRMECFDISHTGGERTVGSCVVFNENGALKQDYRKFNIEGIEPGDDYAAMTQVLTRRYGRLIKEQAALPELVIVDGGKGQMTVAIEVMAELGLSDLALLGVSKGPERIAGEETLHFKGREFNLGRHSPALHLIQQIRDEAHRFAITGHRARRAKKMVSSPLQGIAGVGAKRRQALLKHFGGIQEVKNAGIEDLQKAPGISPQLAAKIYDLFH